MVYPGHFLPASKMFLIVALLVNIILPTRGQLSNPAPVFTCESSIYQSHTCEHLGTASHPAYSCQHLKDACDKPSGYYYCVQKGLFVKVYCEMQLYDGGWARYGKSDMGEAWNFVDEDQTEITLEIISPSNIKEMADLKYNQFRVGTDVIFKLQADDSTNPSRVTTRSLPWLTEEPVYISGFGNDHTRIEFLTGRGDRITCFSGGSSKCGQGGTPAAGDNSDPFFVQSIYFGPRATDRGAAAHNDAWSRNAYTWNGMYYYVYAK